MTDRIFKVVSRQLWAEAEEAGIFRGAENDVKDGFIHFSAADQVVETVARHFSGHTDLLLVEVDPMRLGTALRWEVSRGGDLFPHCYGDMPLDSVLSVAELPLGDGGTHIFPSGLNGSRSGNEK